MELISRIMDGSIPYDPAGRLGPVSAGLGAKQDDKIERLKEVPLFEGCSKRQNGAWIGSTRRFHSPVSSRTAFDHGDTA